LILGLQFSDFELILSFYAKLTLTKKEKTREATLKQERKKKTGFPPRAEEMTRDELCGSQTLLQLYTTFFLDAHDLYNTRSRLTMPF
jgi:hypothetical protein